MFQIIRKFAFINAAVKMFVNQIWENIGIQFDNFGGSVTRLTTFLVFKFRITFDTSSWVVFLNENAESSFLFFYIENTGVFSNVSMVGQRECVSFLEKIITIVRYFQVWDNVWKKVIKNYAYFLIIRNMFFCFIKDNIFSFWHLFCEKRNKVLLSVIFLF